MAKGVVVALADPPAGLARHLAFDEVGGATARQIGELFRGYQLLVVVAAVPVAVRAIAPHLSNKHTDPAVVALDELGRFATVIAGAHHGGNELSRRVSAFLGSSPVITTGSDSRGRPALDQLPGLTVSNCPPNVQTRINQGAPIRIANPTGIELPPFLADLENAAEPGEQSKGPPVVLVVSDRTSDSGEGDASGFLKTLVAGVGCSSDANSEDINSAVAMAFASAGLHRAAVAKVATITSRIGLLSPALAPLPVIGYPPGSLSEVATPNPSAAVKAAVGTPSVAEAAALLAAGAGAELALPKQVFPRVTVAIARMPRPRGRLNVAGIGPGSLDLATPRALASIREAQYLVGYSGYLDLITTLVRPSQRLLPFPLGAEIDRAEKAVALAAAGSTVTLVTSGDPGVYAMAQLVSERASDSFDLEVIPGVTAANAASAASGAILGHDHAYISLSDLLTPWETIKSRLVAAAQADFVVALYNPRSEGRRWQLDEALAILGERRDPNTPVLLARRLSRPGQSVEVTTISQVNTSKVDMETVVIVGSSTTTRRGELVYTPRGYRLATQIPAP